MLSDFSVVMPCCAYKYCWKYFKCSVNCLNWITAMQGWIVESFSWLIVSFREWLCALVELVCVYSKGHKSMLPYLTEICAFSSCLHQEPEKNVCYGLVKHPHLRVAQFLCGRKASTELWFKLSFLQLSEDD